MECNRDEALRAKQIAEQKFLAKNIIAANKYALKAQTIYPSLDGISQFIDTLNVHLCAEARVNGEKDWYAILSLNPSVDDEVLKKQYKKLALALHPDKNKSVGAEAAFKLVAEAWGILSDKTRRLVYDQKRNAGMKAHDYLSSKLKKTSQTRRNTTVVHPPACPSKPNTFWTTCNHCKMQYEYPSVYINNHLVCTTCHKVFVAVENGKPIIRTGFSAPGPSNQQANYESNGYATENYSSFMQGTGFSVPEAATQNQQADCKSNTSANEHSSFTQGAGSAAFQKPTSPNANASFKTAPAAGANVDHQTVAMKKKKTANQTISNSVKRKADQQVHALSKGDISKLKKGNNADRLHGVGAVASADKVGTHLGKNRFCSNIEGKAGKKPVSNRNQELSQCDILDMLKQCARELIWKKLKDKIATTTAAKIAEKETAKQKAWQSGKDDEKRPAALQGNTPDIHKSSDDIKQVARGKVSTDKPQDDAKKDSRKNVSIDRHHDDVKEAPRKKDSTDNSQDAANKFSREKVSTDEPLDDSHKEDQEPISIEVPDSDFHDFDKDRSESSFQPEQMWATYDNEDGMPRYYALVRSILSLNPFKICMSYLNSKSNNEFSPLNWVGRGFAKPCGEFRLGRKEKNDTINLFSHRVKWEKLPAGLIRILPQKSDIWALYRNWSPNWNEHTPDEVLYKYDMVEVLDDYNEEHGISVSPLVKVPGFRTIFRRHLDPNAAWRIPREEMFRFSHHVPSYLLTGNEAQNAPKGCIELDPAATPFDLLQEITEP